MPTATRAAEGASLLADELAAAAAAEGEALALADALPEGWAELD